MPIPHITRYPMSSSTPHASTPAYEPASVYLLWILGFGGIYYPGVFLHNSNNKGRLAYGCDTNEHDDVTRTLIKELTWNVVCFTTSNCPCPCLTRAAIRYYQPHRPSGWRTFPSRAFRFQRR